MPMLFGIQVTGSSPCDRRQNACNELRGIVEKLRVKGRSMSVLPDERKSIQDDFGDIQWGILVLKLMANDREIMPGQWKRFRNAWSTHLDNKVCKRQELFTHLSQAFWVSVVE